MKALTETMPLQRVYSTGSDASPGRPEAASAFGEVRTEIAEGGLYKSFTHTPSPLSRPHVVGDLVAHHGFVSVDFARELGLFGCVFVIFLFVKKCVSN